VKPEPAQQLVSVCIPAYNAEKYIAECIESVLGQSYPNIEIVAVNDGSSDRTADVLRLYESKGVKVFHQRNQGQCAAANAAYKACSGGLIKFMDADDLLSKDFIKHQVKRLEDRTDAIASAGWGRFYNDDLSTFHLNPESVWRDMKPVDWLVESMWNGPNMMQCALWLVPRAILNRAGLWDERLSLINDFDFFIRVLLAADEVLFTHETVLYYRSGSQSSLSGQKSKKAYQSAYLSTQLGVETILAFENTVRTRKICSDSFQLWKYQFYPEHKDLYLQCEQYIRKLGGSQFPFPGGIKTKKLSKLLGWKLTKRLIGFILYINQIS
jgi:glycosyltransferase involved in cell wall biosynthesis